MACTSASSEDLRGSQQRGPARQSAARTRRRPKNSRRDRPGKEVGEGGAGERGRREDLRRAAAVRIEDKRWQTHLARGEEETGSCALVNEKERSRPVVLFDPFT
jgi:hypothetical protein